MVESFKLNICIKLFLKYILISSSESDYIQQLSRIYSCFHRTGTNFYFT